MNQTLLSTLSKQESRPTPDTIMLWHATAKTEALKSFLDEGAKSTGRGMGGQSPGFYVWDDKTDAISHLTHHIGEDGAIEGLLVGVTAHKNDLHYPTWQFDIETAKVLNALLYRHQGLLSNIKNLEYQYEGKDGLEKDIILSVKTTFNSTAEQFKLRFFRENSIGTYSLGCGGIAAVGMQQALIDELCKYPEFKKDYDQLLQEVVSHPTKELALKYCGKKPLPVDEISHVQADGQGKIVETPVYTSSMPQGKQANSSMQAAMAAKKKGPRS